MSLGKDNLQDYTRDSIVRITASYTMRQQDRRIIADATLGNIIVTLPSVQDGIGNFFTVRLKTAGGHSLTFRAPDADNKADLEALITWNADGQGSLLYTDGFCWYQMPIIS